MPDDVDEEALAQLLEMQRREAAAGTLLAAVAGGVPCGWVQAIGAYLDDPV